MLSSKISAMLIQEKIIPGVHKEGFLTPTVLAPIVVKSKIIKQRLIIHVF